MESKLFVFERIELNENGTLALLTVLTAPVSYSLTSSVKSKSPDCCTVIGLSSKSWFENPNFLTEAPGRPSV